MNHIPNRAQALKTITLADLLSYPFPPRAEVLKPWLRGGESAMLWAPSGLGKTMLGLTMALAVAGGGSVLGWTAPEPRKVLYVDGEMNTQDLRDRLKLLAPTIVGLDGEAAGRNLKLLSRQFQAGDVLFPDLGERDSPTGGRKAGQDRVIEEITKAQAELVVLDNVSTLIEVTDENDAAAVTPVLSFLMRLKQVDVAAIVIHHSGKSGESYRGSSKLATTFEVIMGLRPLDGRSALDGTGFELRWDKYRGRPSAATRDMEVILAETAGGTRWEHRAAPGSEIAVLVDTVRSGEFFTQRQIAEKLGWDTGKVSRMKALAVRRGEINAHEWAECLRVARDEGTGEALVAADGDGPVVDF